MPGDASGHKPLPAPEADPESPFGVDANVNVGTTDQWLGREDVAYRDMRLFFDPADYASIGGDPNLTATVEGFKVVPFPYLATLPPLPVANAYDGQTAWTVEWADDGSIVSATPNFRESGPLLDELFPKDKAIFLMCGAGGYAGQAKTLLVHLGWNADKLYNIGGFWNYTATAPCSSLPRTLQASLSIACGVPTRPLSTSPGCTRADSRRGGGGGFGFGGRGAGWRGVGRRGVAADEVDDVLLGMDVQLLVEALDVGLGRVLGNVERGGHVGGGTALRQQLEHLLLSLREAVLLRQLLAGGR